MAERGSIEVKGLKELAERLSQIDKAIADKIGRAGTNAAAQVIKKRAIANAPRRTGNLAKSIITKYLPKSERTADSQHIVTVRGRGKKTKGGKQLAGAFYAHFVEFGTVKMPAQPFLRPAFDAGKEESIRAMAKKLGERIQKENKPK